MSVQFNGATRTFSLRMPIRTGTRLGLASNALRERKAVRWFWKTHEMWVLDGYRGKVVVTLMRVSPASRASARDLKMWLQGVRDQIASQLGRDDSDRGIEWRYDQRKGPWAVDVTIHAPEKLEPSTGGLVG